MWVVICAKLFPKLYKTLVANAINTVINENRIAPCKLIKILRNLVKFAIKWTRRTNKEINIKLKSDKVQRLDFLMIISHFTRHN